jgi:hypothetical protein
MSLEIENSLKEFIQFERKHSDRQLRFEDEEDMRNKEIKKLQEIKQQNIKKTKFERLENLRPRAFVKFLMSLNTPNKLHEYTPLDQITIDETRTNFISKSRKSGTPQTINVTMENRNKIELEPQ